MDYKMKRNEFLRKRLPDFFFNMESYNLEEKDNTYLFKQSSQIPGDPRMNFVMKKMNIGEDMYKELKNLSESPGVKEFYKDSIQNANIIYYKRKENPNEEARKAYFGKKYKPRSPDSISKIEYSRTGKF